MIYDVAEDPLLDGTVKGFPGDAAPCRLSGLGALGWSLAAGDLPMPAAVIRTDRLAANRAWMRRFLVLNGLEIAPHGKTTMAPELFRMQLADGAWAITVATAQQMLVAFRSGARRVVLANQPMGRNIAALHAALAADPGREAFALADSPEGLGMLARGATGRRLGVLVEIGVAGGRTGCRDDSLALELARRAAGMADVFFAGFEAFEGVLDEEAAVATLLGRLAGLTRAAAAEGLFAAERPAVVSAGGTSWFDLVAERFAAIDIGRPLVRLIRSGCYITLDHFGYAAELEQLADRRRAALPEGRLAPALEVWAAVQSVPEPGLAFLTCGKRDAGFDAGLPQPVCWLRPGAGAQVRPLPEGHRIAALNDQHAYLHLPADSPLRVGDLVQLGIAHPCTTFDRWRLIWLIDAETRVTGGVATWF